MFNAQIEKDNIVNWIHSYFQTSNATGVVIGISGGKDSAVAAGLCCEALGPSNVVGLTLPCHSKEKDRQGAQLIASHFGFELIDIDLTSTYDTFVNETYFKELKLSVSLDYVGDEDEWKKMVCDNANINLKPRLRMAACYYMTALLKATRGGLWLTTANSNACEKYVGYYTRGGDEIGDIYPLVNLTVPEVIAVGECLGVPHEVLHRTPDDGLSGKTDEEKMGISYMDVHRIIRGEADVSEVARQRIEQLHRANLFKLTKPNVLPITIQENYRA